MKNNLNRLISKVKFNAYKLKSGGQIPAFLFSEICSLDHTSTEKDVRVLIIACEHFMRIKGYYFRYHFSEIDKQVKDFIESQKGKEV